MAREGAHAGEVDSDHERWFDEYLELALAGSAPDPAEFLKARGVESPHLEPRLRALHKSAWSAPAAPVGDLPFESLGDFRLLERIGQGGMGLVFSAEQVSLHRKVALKILRPELASSPLAAERLKREAHTIARLRHPNIVAVFGFGEHHGVRYLAMEYVEGRTLEEELRHSDVSVARKVRWIRDIARALAHAHREGVIHRDVKPSNVRITPDDRALLLDFGLVRSVGGETATLTDSFAGSPSYASPEQIRDSARVDARTDVYSLGVMLYRALTGVVPFQGETVEAVFHRVLAVEPIPPRRLAPAIPRDLEVVTLKAMERRLERRIASAEELADELDLVLELRPIRSRPPGAFERLLRAAQRRRVASASLATALVALLAFGGYSLVRAREAASQRRADAQRTVGEARQRVALYGESRARHAAILAEVEDLRYQLEHRVLAEEEYRRLDEHEEQVDALGRAWETTFYEVLDLLGRAERLDPAVEGAESVRGELYREKMREAELGMRTSEAEFYRALVHDHDPDGRLAAELAGECRIDVATEPADAEVHVFRYVEQSKLRAGGEAREVAVPFGGAPSGLFPGTWCLRLVEPAGNLETGDLVIELDGHPIEGTLLVTGATGRAESFERLASIDAVPIRDARDVEAVAQADAAAQVASPSHVFRLVRAGGEQREVRGASLSALGLRHCTPAELASSPDRPSLACRAFHRGALVETLLDPAAGVRTTASPLFLCDGSLVGRTPLEDLPLPRGQYLILLRRAGHEDLRVAVDLGAGRASVAGRLFPLGTTPPGFVRLPRLGDGDDVWMQEREVISAEYLEYLNDPATQAEIASSSTATRYPRYGRPERSDPYWNRTARGDWELPVGWAPELPVIGLSWDDARAYAAWCTRRGVATGLAGIEFALPTRQEFEYAGLAGLKRVYTWGSRFRPKWSLSCFAHAQGGIGPVLQFPVDESPFGAYDFCGSAGEWLDAWYDQPRGLRTLGGGAWGQPLASTTKVTGGNGIPAEVATGETGMRLLMRRRGERAR